MRSKCCKDLYLDDGDTRAQRLDEVTASLKWQRIAPPFIGTSVECSEEILFDGRFFEVGSTWCGWVFGREARQGAPAVIARNLSVDSVRVNGEIKPYVAVSLNPNGAYSVTIQPRLIDGISRYPDAVVTCDIPAGVDIIGVLGVGCDLRLHLSCVPSKVYVQSLLADEAFELTEGIEGNTVTLTAELARRIFGGKDLSAPALMLKIL